MKFKAFLRGLGTGIIFAAIICFAAYKGTVPDAISDEEIIERAKNLGMVEKENLSSSLLSAEMEAVGTDKEENTDNILEGETEESEKTTEEITTENTAEALSQKDTEGTTEDQTMGQEGTTEDQAEGQDAETETPGETVTITVKGGSSSFSVCQKMQTAGLIEKAADFDAYLIENGYAARIRAGTYTLRMGMSFEELAEAISSRL